MQVLPIVCTWIVCAAGAAILLYAAAALSWKAIDKFVWTLRGAKYIVQYALDAEGRRRTKQRVDAMIPSENRKVVP